MSERTETTDQQTVETPQGGEETLNAKGILSDLQAERAKRQRLEEDLQKLQAAQQERETKELEEKEEFKALYEQSQARIAELEPVANAFASYEESKKSELLEKLGDDAEGFKDLPLDALEKVVKKLSAQTPPVDPGKPGGTPSGKFGGYDSMRELALAAARGVPGAREAYNETRGKGGA